MLGGKFPTAPPSGAGEREILLTIELQTDSSNDYRDIYYGNQTIEAVRCVLTNVSHAAFPHRVQFEMPSVQITEDPDYAIDGFGIVGQTLTLRAIAQGNLPYEFRILCNYSQWFPVYTYN